jgi:hypothetical protein
VNTWLPTNAIDLTTARGPSVMVKTTSTRRSVVDAVSADSTDGLTCTIARVKPRDR